MSIKIGEAYEIDVPRSHRYADVQVEEIIETCQIRITRVAGDSALGYIPVNYADGTARLRLYCVPDVSVLRRPK